MLGNPMVSEIDSKIDNQLELTSEEEQNGDKDLKTNQFTTIGYIMKNKILFSTAIAATLAALATDAKTVVTPLARSLNPVTYYSASTLVVRGGSPGSADILSTIYPGAHPLDNDEGALLLIKPTFHFSLGFHPMLHPAAPRGVRTHVEPVGMAPPGSTPSSISGVVVSRSASPPIERTRERHIKHKNAAGSEIPSLDELVRRQRSNRLKQIAAIKKRRAPGHHAVLPLDRNSVRVCIAARPARVPLAVHRLVPRHGIAAKYAMPLTKADIERKNEHAKEYKLGYARKSKHLRRLSPDRIAKFKFYPPLRRFDTDVLVAATAPTQPIIAYVPVPTEEKIICAATPAAGVQKTISVTASASDDIIGLPSHEFYAAGLTMKGNVPAKTGINGIFCAAAELVPINKKTKRGYIDQPVALQNIPRGGLHQVTYDELGHSPPVGRA